jgi:hypothetical protein
MHDMRVKDDLIAKIVKAEWKMFAEVPNIGGKAACQEDYRTFEINRHSQAMSWSEATLTSYLRDLIEAEKNGRNLLTEKYGRMMQSTSPSEYIAIKHLLPELDAETIALVDKIVDILLEWEEILMKKYPYLIKKGRPLRSSEDTPYVTSVETYLRGELSTYSLETLKLYYANVLKQKSENINGAEVTLSYTVKRYGYNSLEEANGKLKARG